MAARYQRRTPIQTPDLSLSDSEDSYSSDEEEMPERAETDQLLRQAHHYVITEGGNDSPTIYMERIQRINRSLIQEISQHSYDCDPKLYRRVKQKIDHVLREFEDAVDADSNVYDYDEMLEYCTAAAEVALYRMDSSPATPDSTSTQRTKHSKEESERTYLYGGTGNHPEVWYHKAAASLPFPETIRMADWEGLRIQWDLENTGDTEKRQPITGDLVLFNDPRLAHHNSLTQYESGSRFKLPAIDPSVMTEVNKFGTIDSLDKTVADFNQSDRVAETNGEYKYAPRVFLDRLDVGQQINSQNFVDDGCRAVNSTPTKPCPSNSGSSKIGSTPPATRVLLNEQQQASNGDTSHTISADHNNDLPVAIPVSECEPQSTSSKLSSYSTSVSPAIQRIKAATEASIRSSPLPQSPPAHPETTQIESSQTQIAAHVLIPAKRDRGRPRKHVLPATTDLTEPTYHTIATGKRKRLSVNTVVKADTKEVDEVSVPAKRKRTTSYDGQYKSMQELRREASATRPCTPTTINGPSTPGLTPASTGTSVASTPPVIKARAAGKQKRRPKACYEERVTPERYAESMAENVTAQGHESIQQGSTRSGKLRRM